MAQLRVFAACVGGLLLLGPLVAPLQADQAEEGIAARLGITVEQVQDLKRSRGLTNDRLAELPPKAVPGLLRRLSLRQLPLQRIQYRNRLSGANDPGRPAGAVLRAVEQASHLRETSTKRIVAGMPVAQISREAFDKTAGLEPKSWRWLGPGNIGGLTKDILIHPTDHERMWAAAAGGGVYSTTNGGKSWRPCMALATSLVVTSLAMDPTNPQVLYAGTGEWAQKGWRLGGSGLLQSTDGGESWKVLAPADGALSRIVNRVAVSRDGKALLVATDEGLHRSTDGGATWTAVLSMLTFDVEFDPTDDQRVVASGVWFQMGGLRGEAGWYAGLYFSEDGGATWLRSQVHGEWEFGGAWTSRAELTYAKANPKVVYASIDFNGGTLARSTDGGKSYTLLQPKTASGERIHYMGDQGFHNNAIWAGDPRSADFVLVGGIDIWGSLDGGKTLSNISNYYQFGDERTIHPDHHAIVSHPAYDGATNRTVFFGCDGGVWRAKDIVTAGPGEGWEPLNNDYGVTQFYGAAGYGTLEDGYILGGAQDNGTLLYRPDRGPNGWERVLGGDGGWCAIDPREGGKRCYGESQYLNIQSLTIDVEGTTQTQIAGWRWIDERWGVEPPPPYALYDTLLGHALFIPPFVLDPNNPDCMLAGGRRLWRSRDVGTQASARFVRTGQGNVALVGGRINLGLRKPLLYVEVAGPAWECIRAARMPDSPMPKDLVSAICVATGDSNIVWVGYRKGGLAKTRNGTADVPDWTEVLVDDGLANRTCTSVTVVPQDHEVVYATFGSYRANNVWRTTDGGSTWASVGNALPEAPAWTLTVNPANPKWVYVGTEVGVFASEDGGDTWSPANEGPVNCPVTQLFWMGEALVAATYGRGMYAIDLSRKAPHLATEIPPPAKR